MLKKTKIPTLKLLIRDRPITIDKLVYIALISPVMTLPQLYLVLTTDAQGVSVITWATYLIVSIIWLSYGIKHHIKPVIILHTCWIIIDAVIVVGLLAKN